MKYSRIVPDASVWEHMDGETPTIKRLNSYLTVGFVDRKDVPADECLPEARHLASLWRKNQAAFEQKSSDYLVKCFATSYPYNPETNLVDADNPEVNERRANVARASVPEVIKILDS